MRYFDIETVDCQPESVQGCGLLFHMPHPELAKIQMSTSYNDFRLPVVHGEPP